MAHAETLPSLPPPSKPDVVVATAQEENPPPVHARKPSHRKPAAGKPATAGDASATTQSGEKPATSTQAANSATSDISPIGQLSSVGEGGDSQGRHNIEQLINNTENGLSGIKRSLSSDEQVTSAQIKTFLAKAKQALAENDLDGAQTLATKAKVLLDELTKK